MKRKLKNYSIGLVLSLFLIFTACSEDYLNVSDPNVLSEAIYPQSVDDLELVMNDLYGRLRDGYWSLFMRSMILISKENDHGYNGAEFNEFALIRLNPDLARLRNYWQNQYTHIAKCNDFLVKMNKIKETATLTSAQQIRIGQMEAEARFLRAINYFCLINQFGEYPILTEADKAKMGVPLWTELATSILGTNKARSTQGEVYDFIISDLLAAVPLMEGKGIIKNQKARINEWAIKSLLAKAYIFSLQWSKAQPVLKDIIDNSGKQLVSYDILRNMFNGKNEFNSESIWEVNYTTDMQANTGINITGTRHNNYVSITYDRNGSEVINGFSNFYVHDRNIPRFGFDDTTTVYQNRPDYIAKSKQIRLDKTADPRLWCSVMQPYVDSVNLNDGSGKWYKILKGRMEGYPSRNFKGWNNRKYAVIDKVFSRNCGINIYVFRLPEIYLYYAEALIKDNKPAEALEYINKVHRRAYGENPNQPSPYDYLSLTDRTKTVDPTDHLANDPLKYERFAEFLGEGLWWFDVRRWNIGPQEATYYKRVMGGVLEWQSNNYGWPIPTLEINSNSLIVQNP
jgi:hypothetical protein